MGSPPRKISVTFPVTLGQLLKLAAVVSTGGQAKQLINSGAVSINGEVETRRGRKLAPGDRVAVGDEVFVVEAASADTT